MQKNHNSNSGQVALAILLLMSVVLLVSVAVATRTTRDIAQTIETSSASKVFTQAESGTEAMLTDIFTKLRKGEMPTIATNVPGTGDLALSSTSMTVETSLETDLAVGESAQVMLNGAYSGNMSITWTGAAWMIISTVEEDITTGNTYTTYRYLTNCTNTLPSSGFSNSTCSGSESTTTHTVGTNTQFVRIMPIKASTSLEVTGLSGDLPAQQFVVTTEAVGTATDIQQNAKIQATTSHLLPPPFLDFALYNGGGDTTKP